MHAGRIIPGVVLVASATAMAVWFVCASGAPMAPRVHPDKQRQLTEKLNPPLPPVPTAADAPRADGKLERGEGVAANLPGDWPQFRGPMRDGICRDDVPLAAMITRLDWQKGLDITGHVIGTLLGGAAGDAQFIALGSGAAEYEQLFAQMAGV